MGIRSATVYVDGMTCPACEARIVKSLLSIEGLLRAEVHVDGGKARVVFDDELTDLQAIKAAIEKLGYAIREKKNSGTTLALGIGLLLVAVYLVAGSLGLFSALPQVDASIGYAMLFVVGLLTSVHCIAMCGGIALSQSVRGLEAKSPAVAEATRTESSLKRLMPALGYNAGRVLAYTVIGGIAGAVGAAFSFSATMKGVIAGLAGAFMVVFSLKMLGLLNGLPRLANPLPLRLREAGKRFIASIGHRGPFAVGLLNGLMPCGPLQTMQLYALGTGSLFSGALSMFIFSLGTVPLMILFGLTAAFLPRRFVPVMVKASAVLVLFLGFLTFGRAAALAGLPLPGLSALSSGPRLSQAALPIVEAADRAQQRNGALSATIKDGTQYVVTEFKGGNYVPFTVQAGLPLKWTIRVGARDLNGCNNPMTVPAFGIKKKLVPGDNLVEFTPVKEGRIAYSCWMGMVTSEITVVRELGGAQALKARSEEFALPDLLAQAPGGACCGAAPAADK